MRDRFESFGKTLNDGIVQRDQAGEFDRGRWNRCAEFGVLSMGVPRDMGGSGDAGVLSAVLAMEGFGKGCADNGLSFALNAQLWTVQLPILHHGSDDQKRRLLPALCTGERIGAHAITEEDSGSDVFAMSTTAERIEAADGVSYLLNGRKRYVTLGPVADVALILASTAPALGRWGITAFIVERGAEGIRFSPSRNKMGLRTVPIGEIEFVDCVVPEANRLGAEGAGFGISNSSLEYERCCILASHLGAMERQLENAVAHAKRRRQFGQPIGKFQSVSNRIAEMKLRLETARLLLYKVAWLKDEGRPAMLESALLKLHLSESFVASGLDAVRTFGGAGYMTDDEVERDLRDAIGGVLYAGTSDIQRNIIARSLGL